MMDSKTLVARLKKRPDLDRSFQEALAAGVDDGGPVGVGAERFTLKMIAKKRLAAN